MPVVENPEPVDVEPIGQLIASNLVLVNVQASTLPAAVAVLSKTNVAVVAVAGGLNVTLAAAVPVQVADDAIQPVGMISVMVVAVPAAVSVLVTPGTPVPDVVVEIVSVPKPLSPLKMKSPKPPLLILVSVTVATLLVSVSVAVLLASVLSVIPEGTVMVADWLRFPDAVLLTVPETVKVRLLLAGKVAMVMPAPCMAATVEVGQTAPPVGVPQVTELTLRLLIAGSVKMAPPAAKAPKFEATTV